MIKGHFLQAKRQPDFLPSIPNLTRWEAGTLPLFHRNMGLHWHDMCAESLGMPKVALLFLSRGPIHQVRALLSTH